MYTCVNTDAQVCAEMGCDGLMQGTAGIIEGLKTAQTYPALSSTAPLFSPLFSPHSWLCTQGSLAELVFGHVLSQGRNLGLPCARRI